MTPRLVYGRYTDTGNAALARWAAMRMPHVNARAATPFGEAECVGVEHDRRLVASVVFHDWDPMAKTLQVSMAASTPMWARRSTILQILDIPFGDFHARKLYTVIPSSSQGVIRFNKHLGFKEEGRLSEHFAPRLHAVVLGLKRHRFESFTMKLLQGHSLGQADLRTASA